MTATHEVTNQPPPLVDYDVFSADRTLGEAVHRYGAGWAGDELKALGTLAGGAQAQLWADEANRYPPVLRTHDRYGHRLDEVDYHPSYHQLLRTAIEHGLHATPWADERPGAHVVRAAGFYVWSQTDAGHGCPVSMTYAAVPALSAPGVDPDIAAAWLPRLASRTYDSDLHPGKASAIAGMAMTEKQGGSDVRAGTTRATPTGDSARPASYALTGHKWFCSAPMSDLFLVLAQAPGGLSCFLVPRVLPDASRNPFLLQRLKDKLGNRSNASSEVEFDGTLAWLVGPEGRGVATITQMVNATRLDCVIGSACGMRQGVTQAIHHASHRSAFGRTLVDQPLMANVLADLAIESQAATLLAMRLAHAVDAGETALRRLGTAIAKYHVCKSAPRHAAEALECLGGAGYVEESGLPRLYREAPLNGIWEGSGNVNALDVLRAMSREPQSVEALRTEIGLAAGADRRLDAAMADLEKALVDVEETSARRLVERMCQVFAGSLLVRHAAPAIADAYCATRLGGNWGQAFGTLPAGTDTKAIIAQAAPQP
jgi:putative acyl-CoA dehydrogenase